MDAEQRRRKAVVDAHVATYGWVCPGWGVGPHPSTRLEACHVRPIASGGFDGPLVVYCHACNNRMRFKPNRRGQA